MTTTEGPKLTGVLGIGRSCYQLRNFIQQRFQNLRFSNSVPQPALSLALTKFKPFGHKNISMDNTKEIDPKDFESTFNNMRTFQLVHNELKKDFELICELAKNKIEDIEIAKPLIRGCIKELFSLIEADIYLLNQFNPYLGYNDRDDFTKKFKKTFKHHAITFKKQGKNLKFNSSHFKLLLIQKNKRDQVTHPKGRDSIRVQKADLENIYDLFTKYNSFVSESMTNIFISTKFNLF